MWNAQKLIAKFKGMCSFCKCVIKVGEEYTKDCGSFYCVTCEQKELERIRKRGF